MYYYVAMHNGPRSCLLAGPYSDEAQAESSKSAAHERACEVDGYNWFHTLSLGKSESIQKTAFGPI